MNREQIIEKAKKLRELGMSDIKNEAETALKFFEKLKSKHCIKAEELEDELRDYVFKYKNATIFFAVKDSFQILSPMYCVRNPNNKSKLLRGQVEMRLTYLDYIAIKTKYDFYQSEYMRKIKGEDRNIYKKNPKAYAIAFVIANKIASSHDNDSKTYENQKCRLSKLTSDASIMSLGIEKSDFYTPIS